MEEYDLERFLKMQELFYASALREIQNGRKRTHWIWFIFPQLRSLGRSSHAFYYGIADIKEAEAYIAHPVLGARLREISQALLALPTDDACAVMGDIDALKLRSCMTLFACATEDNLVFLRVLKKFYAGKPDGLTLAELKKT